MSTGGILQGRIRLHPATGISQVASTVDVFAGYQHLNHQGFQLSIFQDIPN
jgi:hypothetical protein